MAFPLYESNLKSLKLLGRGKVRDMYAVDGDRLLIVTSDRLSASMSSFPIRYPTRVRAERNVQFLVQEARTHRSNHLDGAAPESVVKGGDEAAQVKGRAVVVKRLKPLPIEAVVRGYLIGSGWKDYQKTGAVCGIPLPAGLKQADKLPEVIFTPATKAGAGAHDENISYERAEKLIGKTLAAKVRDVSFRLYREAAGYARGRGIIIADTKFEFGTDEKGNLVLIDEALTADSSRFWPADRYQPVRAPRHSTSNTCATIWKPWIGTKHRLRHGSRRK